MTDTRLAPIDAAQIEAASLKIHVDEPFAFEGPQFPLIHEVRRSSALKTLCGLDATSARWSPGGNLCAACDMVEMDMFDRGLLDSKPDEGEA